MSTPMEQPSLPPPAVSVGVAASDWREAIRSAGDALEEDGTTAPGYADRMVAMVDDRGPYIVIAPGVALAHARPGDDVLRTGWSVVTLAQPVVFGHPHHDPVSVVVGFAATEPDAHVTGVARIANLFNDEALASSLAQAASPDAVRALLS
ncbi:PTS sugar transporter subunit IIA [Cnuibacter sp. UC19_7]|uniref:PTS sugar transporter subunit IIA n=1 Tax=Cnuibacter sp. UC19_7 TaxID=3350166 RepID=UPI00366B3E0E